MFAAAALLAAGDCRAKAPSTNESTILLRDVTAQTGITFRHTDGGSGKYYIVEYMSAGLALFDYDSDGDVDIYFLNGAPMPGAQLDAVPRDALYRNDGNWKFTDVTDRAGVGDAGHGMGVAVGDFDNDDDPDIYVNNFGPNVLYRNNGDGTFSDATKSAGVENGQRVGAGAAFVDIDRDGDLDLFVGNYIKFSIDKHVPRTKLGLPYYGSPLDYQRDTNTLYRNNGDGTFTDISIESGIARHAGYCMGLVCSDYDRDGDQDFLVGNDTIANFVFQNDGTGKFEEVGLLSGFAYDGSGNPQGTMGVDCADFDNDGLFDVHVTTYQKELATLYKNLGGSFEDVTLRTGAGMGTLAPVKWGNAMADFDNDGDRDIYIACGYVNDNVDNVTDISALLGKDRLLENAGNGKFLDVTDRSGAGMNVELSGRGAGVDDLDNDGDLDVVILNSRAMPTLLRNDSPNNHHWIDLELNGKYSNRDAVGVRVEVLAGDLIQVDEVRSGRGYQSHFGTRLHFGLAARKRVDKIRVHWPAVGKRKGHVAVFESVEVNRVVRIEEGEQAR
jgi:enediyne biosynthesis protein E4